MTKTITVADVGPVTRVRIPIPEPGGIVVLRARNGRGKTKTLEAVESVLAGRGQGKLEVRDGALRGEVEAFGVKLTVGRSVRRSGELEVTSLEGRLSVAELVDPGLKTPEAADARRIKALVQLAGVAPSSELFRPLFPTPDHFTEIVGHRAFSADGLVEMAESVKRYAEGAARALEKVIDNLEGQAGAARRSAESVDPGAECDAARLQAARDDAIRLEQQLRTQAEASVRAMRLADQAHAELSRAEAAYTGPALAEAIERERDALDLAGMDRGAVQAALAVLDRAQAAAKLADQAHNAAVKETQAARNHEALVARWRQQLAESVPTPPSDDDLFAASAGLARARAAEEQGVLIRRALQQLAEADRLDQQAAGKRQEAEQLRQAARGTDEVLSTAIGTIGCPLRVEHGRLVTDTDRGATYFGDLSHGERWRLALDIAIDSIGQHGVIVIPQEAFESIDPVARLEIARHVHGRGIVCLTAEASADEEITAEVLQANGEIP